jgi:hypothetical protein
MSKKKKATKTVSAEPIVEEQIDPTPTEDVPTIQLDEVPVEEKTEPESVVEAEPQPIVEVVAEPAPVVEPVAEVEEAEPEKSAEVEPLPVVEVVAEPAPEPIPPPKSKPTLIALQSEIESLRQVLAQQAILIKQLMETPARQRKPPTSNGKVSILDTKTGKTYPSKNNAYQSLLKAGELEDLVKQGVFGSDPAKNSFGCYNLFRAYPGRFVEVKPSDAT